MDDTASFLNTIEFTVLQNTDDISSFSCSEPLLNDFLTEDAADDAECMYSVTHLAKYDGEIVGYFTLITDNISVENIDNAEYADYQYRKLPAVKIARLATSEKI